MKSKADSNNTAGAVAQERFVRDFDSLRLKEYEDLQRLVNLAGSLNRGSGIVGKITQMESIAESLRRSDMESPRRSFMDFLHLSMVRLNSLANAKADLPPGSAHESNSGPVGG